MCREIHWWLTFALVILMTLSGCDKSRQSLSDSGSVMDLWRTYTHCYRSADLDEMRDDCTTIDSGGKHVRLRRRFQSPLNVMNRFHQDPPPASRSILARWLPPVPFILVKPRRKWDT